MNELTDNFLWVEKYRPTAIDECILPLELKTYLKDIVVKGTMPNLLLSGGAGTGKTTVARALCDELDSDYMFINASEDSGIDVLRTKIRTYASTMSLNGKNKTVILDESDYLSPNSTQPALRSFIEEFSANCRFILTCNYKNRIIQPLHSRLVCVEFKIEKKERGELAKQSLQRIVDILKKENVTYSMPVLVELIKRYFPDFRKVINELQRYSVSGKIDSGIFENLAESQINDLMELVKNKKYLDVKKWIVNNIDNDQGRIYRHIYDAMFNVLTPNSIPAAVLILANYQYKAAFAADQEINMLACLTEIMSESEFKK